MKSDPEISELWEMGIYVSTHTNNCFDSFNRDLGKKKKKLGLERAFQIISFSHVISRMRKLRSPRRLRLAQALVTTWWPNRNPSWP